MIAGAVIVAGGAGQRLGGIDKPAIEVGGRTLLDRVMDAAGTGDGIPTVVIGPPRELPDEVRVVLEEPPGSGPAAALAAGVAALDPDPDDLVAVLAADLLWVTAATIRRLELAIGAGTGAVLTDAAGRRQFLIGVWRSGPLSAACRSRDWTGGRVADLLEPLVTAEVTAVDDEAVDLDTPEDLSRWT